jgi:hypothetical protein
MRSYNPPLIDNTQMNYILSSEALQLLKCKQFVNTVRVEGLKKTGDEGK